MTETRSNRKMGWFLFLVSTVALVLLLLFAPQWFWTSLPGFFTGIVMIADWV